MRMFSVYGSGYHRIADRGTEHPPPPDPGLGDGTQGLAHGGLSKVKIDPLCPKSPGLFPDSPADHDRVPRDLVIRVYRP